MSLLKKLWPKNSLATIYDREVEANKKRRAKNWPAVRIIVRVYHSMKHGTLVVNPTLRESGNPNAMNVSRLSRREYRKAYRPWNRRGAR